MAKYYPVSGLHTARSIVSHDYFIWGTSREEKSTKSRARGP